MKTGKHFSTWKCIRYGRATYPLRLMRDISITADFTKLYRHILHRQNGGHAGTREDPSPAVASMEYVKGKYYIENGVIYLMNRQGMADGESIVLHYTPSQLVGIYFEVVQ